ncbi:MAG: hypothetical protein ACYDEF_14075 [Methanosarcina sp.]
MDFFFFGWEKLWKGLEYLFLREGFPDFSSLHLSLQVLFSMKDAESYKSNKAIRGNKIIRVIRGNKTIRVIRGNKTILLINSGQNFLLINRSNCVQLYFLWMFSDILIIRGVSDAANLQYPDKKKRGFQTFKGR